MGMAAQRYGFTFNREEVSMMSLPASFKAASCYTWMVRHFSCVGDEEPNIDEIHLNIDDEKAIWKVSKLY